VSNISYCLVLKPTFTNHMGQTHCIIVIFDPSLLMSLQLSLMTLISKHRELYLSPILSFARVQTTSLDYFIHSRDWMKKHMKKVAKLNKGTQIVFAPSKIRSLIKEMADEMIMTSLQFSFSFQSNVVSMTKEPHKLSKIDKRTMYIDMSIHKPSPT